MKKYNFHTSKKAEQYCNEVVNEMVKLFNISRIEALSRVNRHWVGNNFDDNCMLYHMMPGEWANEIYYGSSSFWWKKERKDLIPLPFDEWL